MICDVWSVSRELVNDSMLRMLKMLRILRGLSAFKTLSYEFLVWQSDKKKDPWIDAQLQRHFLVICETLRVFFWVPFDSKESFESFVSFVRPGISEVVLSGVLSVWTLTVNSGDSPRLARLALMIMDSIRSLLWAMFMSLGFCGGGFWILRLEVYILRKPSKVSWGHVEDWKNIGKQNQINNQWEAKRFTTQSQNAWRLALITYVFGISLTSQVGRFFFFGECINGFDMDVLNGKLWQASTWLMEQVPLSEKSQVDWLTEILLKPTFWTRETGDL